MQYALCAVIVALSAPSAGAGDDLSQGAAASTGNEAARFERVCDLPEKGDSFIVSDDGMHMAAVTAKGSRQIMVVDGEEGPEFDSINGQSALFSPDGSRFAYVAVKSGRQHVIIDGEQGPGFDGIHKLIFSPDSRRFAYIAINNPGDRHKVTHTVVADDHQREYRQVDANLFRFSPDSNHLVYPIMKIVPGEGNTSKEVRSRHLVVNGSVSAQPTGDIYQILIDPTGRYRGYVSTPSQSKSGHVVIDGQPGPACAELDPLAFAEDGTPRTVLFSDDGRHYLYSGSTAEGTGDDVKFRKIIVYDGRTVAEEAMTNLASRNVIHHAALSPDGRRYAYALQLSSEGGRLRHVVVDDEGKRSREYNSITEVGFSPNSERLMFIAHHNGDFLVLDGEDLPAPVGQMQPGGKKQGHLLDLIVFSPNGTRMAYVMQADVYNQAVIVDGEQMTSARSITDLQFSPDSERIVYLGKTRATESAGTLFINAEAVAEGASHPTFSTGGRLAYLASAGDQAAQHQTGPSETSLVVDGKEYPFPRDARLVVRRDWEAEYPGPILLFTPDEEKALVGLYYQGPKGPEYQFLINGRPAPVFGSLFSRPYDPVFQCDGTMVHLAKADNAVQRVVYDVNAIEHRPTVSETQHAETLVGHHPVHQFEKSRPTDILTMDADGVMYGATNQGGRYDRGMVFRFNPGGDGIEVLHEFRDKPTNDVAWPNTLIASPDGMLYGATGGHSAYGNGGAFRIDPRSGEFEMLEEAGEGALKFWAIDPDGAIYGTSGYRTGVAANRVSIVKWKPGEGNVAALLPAEDKADARRTLGPFVDGGDGAFYGVAGGGTYRSGVIFKLNKDGTGYAVLHEFVGAPDGGGGAASAPVVGSDGTLYGLTSSGGEHDGGIVYRINRDGSGFTILHHFNRKNDEPRMHNHFRPHAPFALIQGADGALYILAESGPQGMNGTLLRIRPDGSDPEILHEFNHDPRGSATELESGLSPVGALFQTSNGILYGATKGGGKHRHGTIYRFVPESAEDPATGEPADPEGVDQLKHNLLEIASRDASALSEDDRHRLEEALASLRDAATEDHYVAAIPGWATPAIDALADAGVAMARLLRAEQAIEYDGMRIGFNGDENDVADLKAAADAGVGPAHLYLGELAGQGKIDGGADQAVSWFERGHELGDAESSARLALHLMLGRGVEDDDPRRADEHVRSLARSAAVGGSALASYLYAESLAKGVGGPMNSQEAESWYLRSAWIGHPLATRWCREHHGGHQ